MIMAQATDPPNTILINDISFINCEADHSSDKPWKASSFERNVIPVVDYKLNIDWEKRDEEALKRHSNIQKC